MAWRLLPKQLRVLASVVHRGHDGLNGQRGWWTFNIFFVLCTRWTWWTWARGRYRPGVTRGQRRLLPRWSRAALTPCQIFPPASAATAAGTAAGSSSARTRTTRMVVVTWQGLVWSRGEYLMLRQNQGFPNRITKFWKDSGNYKKIEKKITLHCKKMKIIPKSEKNFQNFKLLLDVLDFFLNLFRFFFLEFFTT